VIPVIIIVAIVVEITTL